MLRLPPVSHRTAPLFPSTTLFRAAVDPAFASDAGLLRATKGRAQITQEPAVHPGDTDIDIGGDAVRPRKVARPDRGRQTILGVVGEADGFCLRIEGRSEEHTSELQSLMRISYAVFCLKHKNK